MQDIDALLKNSKSTIQVRVAHTWAAVLHEIVFLAASTAQPP